MRSLLSKATLAAVLLVPALALAQDAESANAPTEAPLAPAAATAVPNHLISPAPADKGQIVFFRESKMMGGAVGFKVREGETELGKLRSGRYFVVTAEPGTHEYVVHSETKDVLTLEVEPGETYYVQLSLGFGVAVYRPNLSPSDEATFMGMSKKLKLAK